MSTKGIVARERVFDRGRGCYNCRSFDNGELARNRWRELRPRNLAYIKTSGPIPRLGELEKPVPDERDARLDQIRFMDTGILNGMFGLCLKGARPKDLGGPEGDFVHCKFICDRWDGRDGYSLATSGRPLDKLNDELWDIAESRATKK